uniref:Transmembrane protein n=1 Tax=Heterorhabditis bacteriophora TaxID=37862 RepID=A0A1I7XKM7_HETBA
MVLCGILLLLLVMTCLNVISTKLSEVDPSLWPELLQKTTFTYSLIFKKYPEAMELLKIPNIFYMPPSFMRNISNPLGTDLSHAVHLPETVQTPHSPYAGISEEVSKSSNNPGVSKLFISFLDYLTHLCLRLLFREVTDIFLTKREWLPGQSSADLSIESHL